MEKWLPAVWTIVNDKNGISSYELHRALDVTQKTAWFMLHRIRLAMQAARPSGGRRPFHDRPSRRDGAAADLQGAHRIGSMMDRGRAKVAAEENTENLKTGPSSIPPCR